jgi:hypothetical protein
VSLWTPSGEHPVDRKPSQPASAGGPSPATAGPPPGARGGPGEPSLEDLSPEQRAQVEEMNRQMEEARARMLGAPAGAVIGQQALSFYELAAVYLNEDPPRVADARIAIDALGGVVEALGSRLGEAEQPLRQALHQLQMVAVEAAKATGGAGDAGGAASG